jgi:hypothetical protein
MPNRENGVSRDFALHDAEKDVFRHADPTGFSARLSVGFSPFHKVGFGYATVGVPSKFRLTFYHLNPSYHNKRWIAVGSGLVFIDQHRIRWI